MPTLYYSPGACSLAPHILLREIGLPFALQLVSVADGATGRPDYLAINPKGRVPALALYCGGVLTEAPAILVHLAGLAPDRGLVPLDPVGRARCHEWLNWLSGDLHGRIYGRIWRPRRFLDDPALHPALTAAGTAELPAFNAAIEARLADGREWAVPEAGFGAADAFLLVFYRWGNRMGLPMAALPAWSALTARTLARPAVRETLEQEGVTVD